MLNLLRPACRSRLKRSDAKYSRSYRIIYSVWRRRLLNRNVGQSLYPRTARTFRLGKGNAERQNWFGNLRSGPFSGSDWEAFPTVMIVLSSPDNFPPVLIYNCPARAQVPFLQSLRALPKQCQSYSDLYWLPREVLH
jgi:hypothetical protein